MTQASYEVRMTRPDRKRVKVARYFDSAPVPAVSVRQLAGFLTHKLFSDTERGGAGTFYTITERSQFGVFVHNVMKNEDGHYVQA